MPYSPPANPARMQSALKRAVEWAEASDKLARLKRAPVVREHTADAKKEVVANEAPARKIVGDRLLNPLDVIAKDLERILATILNPFDFSSVTKIVEQQVKEIQAKAPGAFDDMFRQISSAAADRLQQAQKELDDVNEQVGEVQKVAHLTRKLAESGKQSDLQKLEEMIGRAPTDVALAPAVAAGGAVKGSHSSKNVSAALMIAKQRAKSSSARAAALSTDFGKEWNATRPLLAVAPVAVTADMRKRVSGDLTKKFYGKTVAEARKTQQELIDEANVRFANDPKTLAAVERYLRAQTSPLVAAATASVGR